MADNPYSSPTGASLVSPGRTKRRVKRIAPVQAGAMSGLLYFGMSLLFVPILFLIGVASNGGGPSTGLGVAVGGVMLVLMPVMYGAFGFIAGVVGAFIYNICAGIVGGIEVEVE